MMRFLCVVCSSALLSSSLLYGPVEGEVSEQNGYVSGPTGVCLTFLGEELEQFNKAASALEKLPKQERVTAQYRTREEDARPNDDYSDPWDSEGIKERLKREVQALHRTSSDDSGVSSGSFLSFTESKNGGSVSPNDSSTASSSDSGISSEGQSTPPLDTGHNQPYSWHPEQSQANTPLEPNKDARAGSHYASTQLLLKSVVVPPSTRARSSSVSTCETHAVSPLERSTSVNDTNFGKVGAGLLQRSNSTVSGLQSGWRASSSSLNQRTEKSSKAHLDALNRAQGFAKKSKTSFSLRNLPLLGRFFKKSGKSGLRRSKAERGSSWSFSSTPSLPDNLGEKNVVRTLSQDELNSIVTNRSLQACASDHDLAQKVVCPLWAIDAQVTAQMRRERKNPKLSFLFIDEQGNVQRKALNQDPNLPLLS